MFEDVILIKPGEIVLKGLNKGKFVALLCKNIKEKLKSLGEFPLLESDSTFVVRANQKHSDLDGALELVKNVFGISKLGKAKLCNKDLDTIKSCCLQLIKESKSFNSFKVEAKRIDKKFVPCSAELCPQIGEFILQNVKGVRVDVHNPDLTLKVEIRRDGAYIYVSEIRGLGGMPVGCCGRGNVLISGGIDSPVAAYMLAKRGLNLSYTHFESPPYTSELARKKVVELFRKLTKYCGQAVLHTVEFTYIQERIKKLCPEKLFTIIMRRFMLRIATQIAFENDEGALITGESLGQVASQTLEAITCTGEVCTLPVFRPLIGMDKSEIIEIARKIGTFETSILPYEDCCTIFVPNFPKTNPQIREIKEAEASLHGVLLDESGSILENTYSIKTEEVIE
ncbi:MAG: tRNA 4-thiouridine(8) synthase ThiI [Oscillospiraceae bacterium]|nr:tRNA 4-thiouridine(8) synthase ThiI [Oscillospiraceae bacterium]